MCKFMYQIFLQAKKKIQKGLERKVYVSTHKKIQIASAVVRIMYYHIYNGSKKRWFVYHLIQK